MDEEKPDHRPAGHKRQPEEEAVVRDAAGEDAAGGQGAQEDLSMPEDFIALEDDDGEDWQDLILDDVVDAATENDEAIAEALYMAELMQMQEEEGLRRFEEPRLADTFAGAQRPAAHAAPEAEGQAAHPFGAMSLGSGGAAAHADANNHHRGLPPARGESATIRLEPQRGVPAMARRKDALMSARQAVLAGASHSPAVLAGMEEEDAHQDNGWYDSIVQEARRIEEIEDPGLYAVPFQQQQLPGSESPGKEEEEHVNVATDVEQDLCREFSLQNFAKRWRLDPSELDPEEPGPPAKRQARVPPLDDKDVPSFDCGICMETLPVLDLFHGTQCDHRFCVECMATYIEGRISSGQVPIPCPVPECAGAGGDDGLHPEECKKSIDFAAFGSWGDRLTESAIPPSRRAYCPNRQCGRVMLEATGGKTPAMAFCPLCCHAMCATCGLDWSADESGQHDCAEGPEAVLVKKLAAERGWKQCPKCKMLVERTVGCWYMVCRCLFHFCYDCGLPIAQWQEQVQETGEEMCQCHKRTDFQGIQFQ